jgi:hypothetical protein
VGIEIALIGIENGMSDPPREVNIGCPDGNLAASIFHAHDPLKGMFFPLRLPGMARQRDGGLTPADVPLIEAEILSEQPGPPHTIMTETRGAPSGQRVVRGRERECLSIYERPASKSDKA